jgi:hypothetical protein
MSYEDMRIKLNDLLNFESMKTIIQNVELSFNFNQNTDTITEIFWIRVHLLTSDDECYRIEKNIMLEPSSKIKNAISMLQSEYNFIYYNRDMLNYDSNFINSFINWVAVFMLDFENSSCECKYKMNSKEIKDLIIDCSIKRPLKTKYIMVNDDLDIKICRAGYSKDEVEELFGYKWHEHYFFRIEGLQYYLKKRKSFIDTKEHLPEMLDVVTTSRDVKNIIMSYYDHFDYGTIWQEYFE